MDPRNKPVLHYSNGEWKEAEDHAADEMPVALNVNGVFWLEFLCTPELLPELVVGFLYNEGLIEGIATIEHLQVCKAKDNVDVWTNRAITKPAHTRKTSGCTGGVSFRTESVAHDVNLPQNPRGMPIDSEDIKISPVLVDHYMSLLQSSQAKHKKTGGVHASSLGDGESQWITCEDIGRHNTLDKLAGMILLGKLSLRRHVILTTGRVSSEMLFKAAKLGVQIVISCTSPTQMAVQMAEAWDITLVGYARKGRFTVYSHPYRVYRNPSYG